MNSPEPRQRALAVLAVLSAVVLPCRGSAETPEACARRTLGVAAEAYRAAPALRDTLRYVVEAPGSEREPKELHYAFGPSGEVSASDPGMAAVAAGGRLYLTRTGAADRYVSVPFAGDLAAALEGVTGTGGSLFEPTAVAMRLGKGFAAWLDGLRFRQLGPLRVVACGAGAGPGGPRRPEVRLEAENGEVVVGLDPGTGLLADVALVLRPPGAPAGFAVRVSGRFAPEVLDAARGALRFEAGGRAAVASFAELEAGGLRPGQPLPSLRLHDAAGRPRGLEPLRGQVVVLDLWATWCVSCWKTLRAAEALQAWARAERLAVTVVPVNTLEGAATEAERVARVTAFWRSQGFALEPLLDDGDGAFRAMGSPGLPSAVVVDADGVVRAVFSGVPPDAERALRDAVRAALAPP